MGRGRWEDGKSVNRWREFGIVMISNPTNAQPPHNPPHRPKQKKKTPNQHTHTHIKPQQTPQKNDPVPSSSRFYTTSHPFSFANPFFLSTYRPIVCFTHFRFLCSFCIYIYIIYIHLELRIGRKGEQGGSRSRAALMGAVREQIHNDE